MTEITRESTLLEVAAAVSVALQRAGIEATLSGGAAVSIYSANEYQSKDLDFVTAAVIDTRAGQIRIITPTQSVMDRLAAVYAWNDQPSWEQAMMVAARQEIEWDALEAWFINEGAGEEEFQRFRHAAGG